MPSVIPLAPWRAFDKLWTATMGYHADEFRFVEGVTPFSTLAETVGMIVLYVVVIFGGREFMRNRKPLKLNTLFKIHNLLLTLLSGGLLVLFIEQLVPQLWNHGLYANICGADGWTKPLVTLYYVSVQGATAILSNQASINKFRSSTTSQSISNSSTRFSSWSRRSHLRSYTHIITQQLLCFATPS